MAHKRASQEMSVCWYGVMIDDVMNGRRYDCGELLIGISETVGHSEEFQSGSGFLDL